ncbi:MAG: tRNA pseudouridine(54/55) synthase Pus10 [Patescibacteria group bacterium]|nr:tRNA pseudouridine(54/55) synthase Pus10 [Patescibacteria group bacterium]
MNEEKIERLSEKIVNRLKEFEFTTFLLGIKGKFSPEEKKNWKTTLGKITELKLGKRVDYKEPEIHVEIDLEKEELTLRVRPVYLFGYYQKITAGIPQTRWHKKRYLTSVQEEIGEVILKKSRGEDHSFHGCGREDIDVVNVGQGRPFVIEIKNPKKRTFDLEEITKAINQTSQYVRVSRLEFCSKKKIKQVKFASPDKVYQATVKTETPIDKESLEKACQKLSGIIISQKTPTRVLRRRANLERKKEIYYARIISFDSQKPVIEIKAQAGTYIKELINGDNGRTQPSLSEFLNTKCQVEKLVVTKVNFPDNNFTHCFHNEDRRCNRDSFQEVDVSAA